MLRPFHIVAWSKDKENRLNPENGICLSATYDVAFQKYFRHFEGKQIIMPKQFLPNKRFLKKHRDKLT